MRAKYLRKEINTNLLPRDSTRMLSSLLSGDSQCSSSSASGLGLLSSNLESPEMSQPSVTLNLLHSFQIFSEFGIQGVGNELGVPSVSDISLSVQEPLGNVVVYSKSKVKEKARTYLWV